MKENYKTTVQNFLKKNNSFTTQDFKDLMPEVPLQTVYTRLRRLVKDGKIAKDGRNTFVKTKKPTYKMEVTDEMRRINRFMIENHPGINFCISKIGQNIILEVCDKDIYKYIQSFSTISNKVAAFKEARSLISKLENFILLQRMITESPTYYVSEVKVPSIEKKLVDIFRDGKDTGAQDEEIIKEFQRNFEQYNINLNKLSRYAARRGVSYEITNIIKSLNRERIDIVEKIQTYFSTQPIEKAWIFGSFSRFEEGPDSDIDILVDYTNSSQMSLMEVAHIYNGLTEIIGKKIDLVDDTELASFARTSVEHDKYLIYERSSTRPR